MNTPVLIGTMVHGKVEMSGIHNFCEWCGRYAPHVKCNHCGEDKM